MTSNHHASTAVLAFLSFLPMACAGRSTPHGEHAPATAITADEVRRHVMILSDDVLEGRGAGYPGEQKAAAYIEERFREAGLATAVQEFSFLPRWPEHPGDSLTSRNVLAVLPGGDASLAGQVIILGAHHDGQGIPEQADGGRYPATDPAASDDTIWNSADDNASSVAAVIEIARSLSRGGKRPRRTIVFATFGAEEHALNGSGYLAQHPWPADGRRVAMVNLEKIGRVPGQPLIAAGCVTSADWGRLLRPVKCLVPELVPDTDHYPFGAMGIPAIVIGTAHEEDTHQPTDESSRLDFDALARRANYVRSLIATLANQDTAPSFAPNARRGAGLVTMNASSDERVLLHLGDHGALKVGLVLPGLGAERAGLLPGDFVLALDGVPVETKTSDRAIEEALAGRASVMLTVARGDERLIQTIEAAR